jgi:hypothetical protein
MAKRVRGSTSRPGQRAPLRRGAAPGKPSTTSAAPPPPAGLTADEEARAAALEAQIVADEKAADKQASAAAARDDAARRDRRATGAEPPTRRGSLALQGSQEYAYVARDLRRIALIGGALIAFLIGLWIVVTVTGIGPF